MNGKRQLFFIGTVCILFGLLFVLVHDDPRDQASEATKNHLDAEKSRTAPPPHPVRGSDTAVSPRRDKDYRRKVLLEDLKRHWKRELAVFHERYAKTKSRKLTDSQIALAEESAAKLLCSQQMAELLKFLDFRQQDEISERERHNPTTTFNMREKYFREKFTDAIRYQLRELVRSNSEALRNSLVGVKDRDFLAEWGFEAAKYATPEELDSFRHALGDTSASETALLGGNLSLVKTDPRRAFESTLEVLAAGHQGRYSGQILPDLLRAMPESVNPAELEALLPPDPPEDAPTSTSSYSYNIKVARGKLLGKWGSIDPHAAIEYIMTNPIRVNPSHIASAVAPMLKADIAVGIEWIQDDLPTGVYKDYALKVAIPRIVEDYPQEAYKLASQITDPELRAAQVRYIAAMQDPNRDRAR